MKHFHLITERDRCKARRYAASPACPPDLADRIRALVKEARAADRKGDWRHYLILAECLNGQYPTPAEIEAMKVETRKTWPGKMADFPAEISEA